MNGPTLPLECRLEGLDRQYGRMPYCDIGRRVANQMAAILDGTRYAQ